MIFPNQTRLYLVLSVLPLALLMVVGATAAAPPPPPKTAGRAETGFAKDVAPLVKTYCAGCHAGAKPAADIALDKYPTVAAVLKNRNVWEKVSQNLSSGHMPPAGSPQPKQGERDRIMGWIDSTLSQADCNLQDPGRVTMRRLNREEYNNTIRDLTGLTLRPADDFPSDDVGYGFDNIGDVLSISPLLMEKYLRAAEKVAQAAIVTPEAARAPVRWAGAQLADAGGSPFPETDGRFLSSEAEVGVTHDFVRPGAYVLRAEAWGQQAGPDPCRMAFRLDGQQVGIVEVKATQEKPQIYEVRVNVPDAGKRRFAVAFVNDYYKADAPDPKDRDRNLAVNALEIQAPAGSMSSAALPAAHKRIIFQTPKTAGERIPAARAIVRRFAARAWRRPVTDAEVERLVRYVGLAQREGDSWERGIQLAVTAALVSPNFLFRVETDKKASDAKAKHTVGDYEMASRLSYFLWSSMPDDELLALAAAHKLQNPAVLAAQVKRMLRDKKARALADNFAGQWLQLRKLKTANPDPARFADWNDGLRDAMGQETTLFFQNVVREDRPVLDFLDGRYTFLNETLARHYGIEGVTGSQFRRVALSDASHRGGVLTQASVLTVTSNPSRTSPVKRGKWVLDNILGTPPPPPPPGVSQLPDDKKGRTLTGTLRERMEQHRANPVCASCHQRMDPIGFGLENFDAVGGWRTQDGGAAVDATGTLPGNVKFSGPAGLRKILMGKKDLFTRSLSERLLTYALGRGVENYDKCNVDAIAKTTAVSGYKFSALVTAIVQSDPFRLRRGDPATALRRTAQAGSLTRP